MRSMLAAVTININVARECDESARGAGNELESACCSSLSLSRPTHPHNTGFAGLPDFQMDVQSL